MSVLKIIAVALSLMFTLTVANSFAADKKQASAKSECSTDMKKSCSTDKSSCSTDKKASAKSECCTSAKGSKLEASNKTEAK